MRYDANNRIMSLSFKRDPAEHADIMLEAGRRLTAAPGARGLRVILGALAAGLCVGLGMEAYRRFLLTPILGMTDVVPLSIVGLQFAPLILLVVVALAFFSRSYSRQRRQALIGRLEHNVYIDTDIFADGIRCTTGTTTFTLDWTAIRDVVHAKTLLKLHGETLTIYIPLRTFASREAFDAAAGEIIALWTTARLKEAQKPAEKAQVAATVSLRS